MLRSERLTDRKALCDDACEETGYKVATFDDFQKVNTTKLVDECYHDQDFLPCRYKVRLNYDFEKKQWVQSNGEKADVMWWSMGEYPVLKS